MSVTFYITPYDPQAWEDPQDTSDKPTSDLHIDRDLFRAKLLEHWGDSRFHESSQWNYWSLSHPDDSPYGDLEVYLQNEGQVVAFKPAPKNILLEFILWYRAFVPAKYPLHLFNSSDWDSLLLTATTTEQDIIDFTGIIG